MKRISTLNTLLLAFVVTIALGGCTSKKNIIATDGSVTMKSQEQLLDDALAAQPAFNTLSAKISLEMISGNQSSGMKVNSQLKLERDRAIQLSIRAPFINSEVFRLNITPDSVYVIDRMSKKYAVENIKDLEKNRDIQFNFNNMQALFTNALFIPGKKSISKKDYNDYTVSIQSAQFRLMTKDKKGFFYNFAVNASDRVTEARITSPNNRYSLLWNYRDFVQSGAYVFPSVMSADATVQKKRVRLNMSLSNLEYDKDVNIENNPPSRYQRVSVLEILKNYIK